MAGCVSKPKAEVVLPPKPQREIMPEVKSRKDVGELVNYYEHLVQQWEVWGDDATAVIEKTNTIIYKD